MFIVFSDSLVVIHLQFRDICRVRGINWSVEGWRWPVDSLVLLGIPKIRPTAVCVVTMVDVYAVLVFILAHFVLHVYL